MYIREKDNIAIHDLIKITWRMAQENNESLWQLIPQKSIRGPRGPIHNTVQRQVLTQLRLVLTPPEFLLVSYCGAKVG